MQTWGSELRHPEPKSWCDGTAVITVGEAQKEDSWGLLVRQSTASSKKQDEKRLNKAPNVNKHVHTHAHATVYIYIYIYRKNLYAYYS